MAEKNSLWKNIRKKAEQNRRTGNKPKEPTKEMLDQERKIKAKYAVGGPFNLNSSEIDPTDEKDKNILPEIVITDEAPVFSFPYPYDPYAIRNQQVTKEDIDAYNSYINSKDKKHNVFYDTHDLKNDENENYYWQPKSNVDYQKVIQDTPLGQLVYKTIQDGAVKDQFGLKYDNYEGLEMGYSPYNIWATPTSGIGFYDDDNPANILTQTKFAQDKNTYPTIYFLDNKNRNSANSNLWYSTAKFVDPSGNMYDPNVESKIGKTIKDQGYNTINVVDSQIAKDPKYINQFGYNDDLVRVVNPDINISGALPLNEKIIKRLERFEKRFDSDDYNKQLRQEKRIKKYLLRQAGIPRTDENIKSLMHYNYTPLNVYSEINNPNYEKNIYDTQKANGGPVGDDEDGAPYRQLSIPMEGVELTEREDYTPYRSPYIPMEEYEPDPSFYNTLSKTETKKPNTKTNTEKSEVSDLTRYLLDKYKNQNSQYTQPRYITERDASSTPLSPAISTSNKESTPSSYDTQAIQIALDLGQMVPNPYVSGAAYVASLPFTTMDVFDSLDKNDYKQAGIDALGYIPTFRAYKRGLKGNKYLDETSKLAKQYKKINNVVNTVNLSNDASKKAQGGYIYDGGGPTGGNNKDGNPLKFYKKTQYDPKTGETLEYYGTEDNKYYRTPNTPEGIDFERTLPELEIIEDTSLYNPDIVGPTAPKFIPSETGPILNPNWRGGDALEYVPIESALLPASLPINATTRLGKLGKFAVEALNPLGGFKNISKTYNKSVPVLNLGKSSIEDVPKTFSELYKTGFKNDPYYHYQRFLNKKEEITKAINTPEGRKRIQSYIDRNSHLQNKTVDDIISDFEKTTFEIEAPQWDDVTNYWKTDNSGNIINFPVDPENAYNWYRKGYDNPSYISIGQNYTPYDAMHILEHEFAHLFQRGDEIKEVDDVLGWINLKNDKDLIAKTFKNFFNQYNPFAKKVEDAGYSVTGNIYGTSVNNPNRLFNLKNQKEYWLHGDGRGKERAAFAAEIRENLLQRGILKNRYDEITPKMLKKHFELYHNTKKGKYNLRLYDIMKKDKKNFDFLAYALNRMPAVVPPAAIIGTGVVGARAMQGSQPEQQSQGGYVNPYMYYAGGPMQSTNNKYSKNNIMKYKRGGGIGGFFKDYGKIMLNAYASPFEALAGKDFYDPEYNTKFGEIADVVNETTTKIGLPIAGSMLLGPQGYQAVKKGTEILSNEFIDTPQQQQQQYPQQQYPPNVNQGLSFAATGGLLNNKEYLVNSQIDSMRNRYKTYKTKYRQGGSINQSNVDFISDEAGLHQENVYNGVPLTRGEGAYANGGAALVEAGEGVIRDKQGNPSFILPDQGDGEPVYMLKPNASHTGFEKDKNGNYIQLPITVADWRKKEEKRGSNFRDPENDYISNPRKDNANQLAMDATEIQKQLKAQRDMNNEMMVNGALQIAAAGGKLNKDLEKILSNDIQKYVEADNYYAYGGYLPKDKGFNMPNSYAKGGSIHIKKSKRGTFTAAAKKRGKSVQEFARQVLANKGNYSAAMVKKANFARNAAKWKHAEGGDIRPNNPGFNALPEYVQAKIMNNMAQGGPIVSNVAQPFQVAAQNRGGMMMANGGMMQQSSQQDQMMQMVQQVQEMLMQGANPQELLKQLMKSGLPQDQAQQLVQAAMQDLESQQQSQQTQMAMGGKMYANGGPPYDLPGMFDMTANPGTRTIESTGETWEDPGTMYEYDAINNYLTNLDTPNVIDAQGNATSILDRQKNINTTTPNPINNFLNTARNYLSARDYLKQRGFRVGNKSMNSMTQVQQPNINPTNQPSPFLTQLLPESLQPKNYNYDQPMTEFDARMSGQYTEKTPKKTFNNTYTGSGTGTPKTIYAPENPIQYTTTGENTFELTDPFANQNTKEINLSPSNSFTQGTIPINIENIVSNNSNSIKQTDSTTPWYKEPFYSKAARYSPLFASAAGVITGLQNKKRSLTPEDILPSKIDLERSRITTAEENRRGLETALRKVRGGAGSSGQLNAAARDLVLTGNKNIAANINKLYETEENTNAMNLYNSNLANQQYRNQFKITNEEMFQNAQKQALRAAQEGTQNLQGAAQDERAQYLQEWIAQNRLNTRSYKTNINGQDVYINPDGKVYDINGNPITV